MTKNFKIAMAVLAVPVLGLVAIVVSAKAARDRAAQSDTEHEVRTDRREDAVGTAATVTPVPPVGTEPETAPKESNPSLESAKRDIRARGYTGYGPDGAALPLTEEEYAIALRFGKALSKGQPDEDALVRKHAKREKISPAVLDSIWFRAVEDGEVMKHVHEP